MFYDDYSLGEYYTRVDPDFSYIRLLHASPDAPNVDVYANGNIIAKNLPYKGFTQYFKLLRGTYSITVFPSGRTSNPIVSTRIEVGQGRIVTIAVINSLRDIQIYSVSEPVFDVDPGKAFVRFVHLSPNAPNVDVTLPDGTRIFRNIGYKGITNYIPLEPETYTFNIRTAGTEDIILHVPNIRLRPGMVYTVYAVGLFRGNPTLQVLIPLDGNTYLKF